MPQTLLSANQDWEMVDKHHSREAAQCNYWIQRHVPHSLSEGAQGV